MSGQLGLRGGLRRLSSGLIAYGAAGLADLRAVLVLTILVFAGWTAVPAIGALALGVWLRRTLGVDPSPSE